jgi:hypothetical protein
MYIFGESQVYRLKYCKAVQQFVLGFMTRWPLSGYGYLS